MHTLGLEGYGRDDNRVYVGLWWCGIGVGGRDAWRGWLCDVGADVGGVLWFFWGWGSSIGEVCVGRCVFGSGIVVRWWVGGG